MRADPTLQQILADGSVWRHKTRCASGGEALQTGIPGLDNYLPSRGWPVGALTEILSDQYGVGELSLTLPALAQLSRKQRWLAWIAPPHLPYAPMLSASEIDLSHLMLIDCDQEHERLWAAEQTLASGICGAVLLWPHRINNRQLRRLQLAAEKGRSWGILFRSTRISQQHSPAALRLHIEQNDKGYSLTAFKCRGGRAVGQLKLNPEGG